MFRIVAIGLVYTALGLAQESRSGVVTGKVIDDSTGLPVSRARVALGLVPELRTGSTVVSDMDGGFRFTGVKAGQYWIECQASGYVTIAGYTLDGPRFEVPPFGEANQITVRLIPAALIEGRLLSDTGEPIAGAKVEAYLSRGSTPITDQQGRFRIDGLAPGEYKLRARLDDSIRHEMVRVDPITKEVRRLPQIVFYSNAGDLSLALPIHVAKAMQFRGLEFRVTSQPLLSASGTVIDSKTGAPLENCEIELRPAGNAVFGDGIPRHPLKQGSFRFELLTPGTYQALVYRSAGFGAPPFVTKLEIGVSVGDLRIVLSSGGRVSGKVSGPRNAGMTSLSLTPVGTYTSSVAQIASDGTFAFDGLAPGRWTIGFAGRPGDGPLTIVSIRQAGRSLGRAIDVVDGDNTPVEIETAELYWVTGTVVDQSGRPVENAIVVFDDGSRRFNQSGKDGNFQIGVIAQDFKVSAWQKAPPPSGAATCVNTQVVRVTRNLTGLRLILCP